MDQENYQQEDSDYQFMSKSSYVCRKPRRKQQIYDVIENWGNLTKDYNVFKASQLRIYHLCRTYSLKQLETKHKQFLKYFGRQKLKELKSMQKQRLFASQFITQLRKIPQHCIIYFNIKQAKPNRYNILVRHFSGQLLAFFENILYCKILKKIIHLVHKIKSQVFAFIFDICPEPKLALQLNIINDNIDNFIYYYQIAGNQDHSIIHNLHKKNKQSKTDNAFNLLLLNNHFFCSNKQLPSQKLQFIGVQLMNRLIKFEQEDTSSLLCLRDQIQEGEKLLSLEFLAINCIRVLKCEPILIFQFIQDLFKTQKNQIMERKNAKKAKQIEYRNPKNIDCHYPQKNSTGSGFCKRCENLSPKVLRKTTNKCIGCSALFQTDIFLNPLCFKDFHQRFDYFRDKIQPKSKHINKQQSMSQEQQIDQVVKKQEIQHNLIQNSIENKINAIDENLADIICQLEPAMQQSFNGLDDLINQGNLFHTNLLIDRSFEETLLFMAMIAKNHPQLEKSILRYGQMTIQSLKTIQKQTGTPFNFDLDNISSSIKEEQGIRQKQQMSQNDQNSHYSSDEDESDEEDQDYSSDFQGQEQNFIQNQNQNPNLQDEIFEQD